MTDREPLFSSTADTLGICPYVLVRRSGVSVTDFKDLVFAQTIAIIDKLLDLEERCRLQTCKILPFLERAIGDISARQVRPELIHLRRDIFNDRLPKAALSINAERELAGRISDTERESLQDWIQSRQKREELREQAKVIFTREFLAKSSLMTRLFRNREFRKGLALASPSLSEALERYLQLPEGSAAHRQRRIERGALRYYARSAFKLSPFSSFTRTGLLRVSEAQSEASGTQSRPRIQRRVVVNRTLISYIAHLISQHPELSDEVPVYGNLSICNDDDIVFVQHQYKTDGPGRLRVPREAIVRLRKTPSVDWILSYLAEHGGVVPLRQLREALSSIVQDTTKAAEFIGKLINIGLLIHKISLPENDSPGIEPLLSFLETISSLPARGLHQSLKVLLSLVERFAAAGPTSRCELARKMARTVNEIFLTLGKDVAANWEGLLLYEDCIERPTVEIPGLHEWGNVLDDLTEFFKCYTAMLDGNISVRETIRQVLLTYFNGGPVLFLKFAERYNQLCSGDRSAQNSAEMSYTLNPLGLENLERLAEIRREFSALLTKHGDADTIDLRAMAMANRWPERLADLGLSMPAHRVSCFSTFCQPITGNSSGPRLVINKIQPGPYRPLLRFCASLTTSGCEEITDAVNRLLMTLYHGASPCELLARFDYNVNLAPLVTEKSINYLSAPEFAGQSFGLGDLYVSLNNTGDIVLLHRGNAVEEEIIPVVFGMMAPTFAPALEFLLLSLGTSEPVLYKPFDPNSWATNKEHSSSVIQFPRLVWGNCVVRRRTWSVPRQDLPQRTANETDFDYFVRIRRWQKQLGLPDEVFARARSFKRRIPLSGDLPEQRNRILHKPQYVHFGNYLLVDLLERLFQESGNELNIEEALPDAANWAQQHITRPVEFVVDNFIHHTAQECDCSPATSNEEVAAWSN